MHRPPTCPTFLGSIQATLGHWTKTAVSTPIVPLSCHDGVAVNSPLHHQRRLGYILSDSAAYSPGDPRLQPAGFDDYAAVVDASLTTTRPTIVAPGILQQEHTQRRTVSPCRITATRLCASAIRDWYYTAAVPPNSTRSLNKYRVPISLRRELGENGQGVTRWSAPLQGLRSVGLPLAREVISEVHSAN